MKTISLAGKVTDNEQPVAGARVHFIGDLATLGAAPEAAIVMRSAVAWEDRITGFGGHRWHAYARYVANQVAGLSYAEFKEEVVARNPSLHKTGYRFLPELVYRMPRNLAGAVALAWERSLTGFAGNRWQCWEALVAKKVVGMTWEQFKREVTAHNPQLAADGFLFQTRKHYQLPLNPALPEYEVVATTDARGRYRLPALPAGTYRVEVTRGGTLQRLLIVTLTANAVQDFSLTAALAAALAEPFVRVAGTGFERRGTPFKRFVGVNITGLLHYGEHYTNESGQRKAVIEHSTSDHRRQALAEANEIKARVVRVFLPHYSCPNEEVACRLRAVLADIEKVGADLYLLPAFIDLYHNRGFFPHPKQEVDDRFYGQQGDMRRLLPHFFVPPYCPQYLSLVDHIVGEFREEPRILAWEIGNELKLDPGKTAGIGQEEFVAFNHFVAARIKALDPNHLVTTGLKSTQHPHMLHRRDLAERLYDGRNAAGRRLIDFVTIHSYVDPGEHPDETAGFALDAKLAKALGMPLVVEETGVSRKFGDCRAGWEQHMRRWFDLGQDSDQLAASGFLEWGFCPQGIADGSNDNCSDRGVIRDVYRRRSELLAV